MIDFVALRQGKPSFTPSVTAQTIPSPSPFNVLTTGIEVGQWYRARDRRHRNNRVVFPAQVMAITSPLSNPDARNTRITLKHDSRTTSVRLDRFREHYVRVNP